MEILLPDGSGLIDSPYNLFFESHQDHVYVRIASEDETEGGHSYTKFVFYEVFIWIFLNNTVVYSKN